ncbi:hypothetical protein APUTEX25_001403 [Auxenochlorella protothecoides]|uniref:Uncharacterized protein n=1 Tax=Auxenochlorella protothecoides TaxID=3075 RepID=A0A3M7L4Y5_AUXPR|nr:hypothetical protein APUTEX25_001403 [Auxenochlorella protothecoides]|eukprot:RMZ56556.1 hypothetical protein APUTEX25_001403 [Auxenochlorella protothecoides]
MLFLAVLGGAAVLEDAQSELSAIRQQKQAVDAELSGLEARATQLQASCETLLHDKSGLQEENRELLERADRLLERQSLLEAAAESLKLENGTLLQQFDRLKLTYEEETAGFQAELAALKTRVVSMFAQFTAGDISAEQLIEYLSASGVGLRVHGDDTAASDSSLTARLDSARSREERVESLKHVELAVGEGWAHQVRLISGDTTRALRLMASAGHAEDRSAIPRAPTRKLVTPPKARDAESRSQTTSPVKLPLALGTAGATSAASPARRVPSVPSSADQAGDENVAANVRPDPAAPVPAKKRGLVFMPKRRTTKPARASVDGPCFPSGKHGVPLLALDRVGIEEDIDVGLSAGQGRSIVGL